MDNIRRPITMIMYNSPFKTAISRRTMTKGLMGLILTMSGIGCSTASPPPAPTPTATPPLGKTLLTYNGHTSRVFAVAWSPNGQRIASGSDDQTVQTWDARTGRNAFIYHGHSDSVGAVAWSPDSRRIASGGVGIHDHTVRVWDDMTGDHAITFHG